MNRGRTVLVLGGGVGGLAAANRLARRLPREHRIVLVDRGPRHLFQPSLLWVAVGDRTPEAIERPVVRLAHRRVELHQGTVDEVSAADRRARVGGMHLTGDAMIVALGADLAPETIPGLVESGHNLYTLEGATAFRDRLARLREGRIIVLTAAPAYKCPAAPYEAAMLIDAALRRRGVRDRVRVDVYAAEPGPMGVTGPATSAAVRAMVESRGIGYYPEHQVSAVDAAMRRIGFANGATAEYDLLLHVPPHRAPASLRTSGLLGASGWIAADRHTFATSAPGVFAIGDVTGIPLSIGKPLPKAGVFARAAALVVADNIAAEWTGRPADRRFDGLGACFLETGNGRAGYGAGDFYAEPAPRVVLRPPSRLWHWGKVLFERRWLTGW